MARPTHYVQATRRDGAEGPAFREFGVVLAWQVMGAPCIAMRRRTGMCSLGDACQQNQNDNRSHEFRHQTPMRSARGGYQENACQRGRWREVSLGDVPRSPFQERARRTP